MIDLLSPSEVQAARPAGAFVANTLHALKAKTTVGTNLLEINEWATDMIAAAGATSCYVDYAPSFGSGPFGKVICISVNDAVLHGLPYSYRVRNGDLVTLDFAVKLNGWVADSAISFVVGEPKSDTDQHMIDTTERALAAGIAAAVPGNRIGDISHAVGTVLSEAGYAINTDFGGHGVGRTMHQDPSVPNDGRPGRGTPLRPGLLLAIEPWIMLDTDELVTDKDGWTLKSATGSNTAHSEHTIAITAGAPLILTAFEPAKA
ncbi:type I methionyl aminopeptidase [Humidisolicoccus flavus]|uniref:type I methionyl aminopeptidase n=1 Tax=Humidisolicoccus flavus TaxID=3111414 RepID=UPI00324DBA8E